ncbi:MAG: DUF2306 domain-containing protein [Xanthomonadales bacterium]|nr:DUF2306 domain-containing protein [Xanthomonadales bacterium]
MPLPLALRRLLYVAFTLACVLIAAYAFRFLFQAIDPRVPLHASFAAAGWAVPAHFFASGLALLVMPLQFAPALRVRWPALHRVAGWLYVLAVLIGGVSGLLLAARAQGGWVTGTSFVLLALLWLGSTGAALYFAVRRDLAAHRRWMLRSAALTFAAPTLRLYLVLGIAGFGLDFLSAYTLAAWLCWTLNLLLVELSLRWPAATAARAPGTGLASRPAGA